MVVLVVRAPGLCVGNGHGRELAQSARGVVGVGGVDERLGARGARRGAPAALPRERRAQRTCSSMNARRSLLALFLRFGLQIFSLYLQWLASPYPPRRASPGADLHCTSARASVVTACRDRYRWAWRARRILGAARDGLVAGQAQNGVQRGAHASSSATITRTARTSCT